MLPNLVCEICARRTQTSGYYEVLQFDKDYVTQLQRTIRAYSSCESFVIRDACANYVIHSVSSDFLMSFCADERF